MSKTYKRIDQSDKADKAKKIKKQSFHDQSTKAVLNQFKQLGLEPFDENALLT
jgi:hypothetical protein